MISYGAAMLKTYQRGEACQQGDQNLAHEVRPFPQ
jgi:hypothetical protein